MEYLTFIDIDWPTLPTLFIFFKAPHAIPLYYLDQKLCTKCLLSAQCLLPTQCMNASSRYDLLFAGYAVYRKVFPATAHDVNTFNPHTSTHTHTDSTRHTPRHRHTHTDSPRHTPTHKTYRHNAHSLYMSLTD